MRIIEQSFEEPVSESTQLPEENKKVEQTSSIEKEMFRIAKEIHELGNKLMEIASKL